MQISIPVNIRPKLFLSVLLAAILPFLLAPNAQAVPDLEATALKTAMLYCIAPIAAGDDVARVATMQNLPELPPEKAKRFLQEGGRVFGVPEAMGQVVLQAPLDKSCRVAVRTLDAGKFWSAADKAFGPQTPWNLVSEEAQADGKTRTYKADLNGDVMAIISARTKPRTDGLQGLITVSRSKE